MKTLTRMILTLGVMTMAAVAQQAHKPTQDIDFAVTYSSEHGTTTGDNGFWLQGGSLELSDTFYHGLGVVGSFTGANSAHLSGSATPGLTLMTMGIGPRYAFSLPKRAHAVSLFTDGEIGYAVGHNSVFPTLNGPTTKAYSLAAEAGGGVDLAVTKHVRVRVVEADWVHTQLPSGGSNSQNLLKLSAGVDFHFRR